VLRGGPAAAGRDRVSALQQTDASLTALPRSRIAADRRAAARFLSGEIHTQLGDLQGGARVLPPGARWGTAPVRRRRRVPGDPRARGVARRRRGRPNGVTGRRTTRRAVASRGAAAAAWNAIRAARRRSEPAPHRPAPACPWMESDPRLRVARATRLYLDQLPAEGAGRARPNPRGAPHVPEGAVLQRPARCCAPPPPLPGDRERYPTRRCATWRCPRPTHSWWRATTARAEESHPRRRARRDPQVKAEASLAAPARCSSPGSRLLAPPVPGPGRALPRTESRRAPSSWWRGAGGSDRPARRSSSQPSADVVLPARRCRQRAVPGRRYAWMRSAAAPTPTAPTRPVVAGYPLQPKRPRPLPRGRRIARPEPAARRRALLPAGRRSLRRANRFFGPGGVPARPDARSWSKRPCACWSCRITAPATWGSSRGHLTSCFSACREAIPPVAAYALLIDVDAAAAMARYAEARSRSSSSRASSPTFRSRLAMSCSPGLLEPGVTAWRSPPRSGSSPASERAAAARS